MRQDESLKSAKRNTSLRRPSSNKRGRMVEVGERAEVEVVRSEAGVAERLQNIIIAENELRNRERELKQIMNEAGLTMDTPTVVVPMTEPDPVLYELNRPRLTAMAVREPNGDARTGASDCRGHQHG